MVLIWAVPMHAEVVSATRTEPTEQSSTVADHNALTASERARSRLWGLSVAEWHRYKALMQGIRGSISPANISPIEVLGIHARDDAERRHYAELWVRAMREDAARVLAFQRAYDEAGKRLYPHQLLIDPDQIPEHRDRADDLKAGDRILFFTQPDCPVCDALLTKLIRRLDEVAGLDLYLTGAPGQDDGVVRAWAKDHRIEPQAVREGRITLNHDGGALEKLSHGKGRAPYLLIRRGQELIPMNPAAL